MCAPLVNVKQGTLRGTVSENVEGGQFFSFLGIPYARPPVGKLRFQDPQPPLPWEGIRDAQEEGQLPVQFKKRSDIVNGSEDCLFLNVYTNSLSGKRPVIVIIPGGRFRILVNNNLIHAPDYLLKHDVVVVSIHYRVGILGFLNMEVESCPGNQAFKDQTFALRWIQENIEAFGGEKDNVTILGPSSGGNSVHYLSTSPLSKGLFHKAIIQSGIADHTLAYRESNKDYGFKIAAILGKESSDSKEIVEFLRTLTVSDITLTFKKIKMNYSTLEDFFLFGPTWDNKSVSPFAPRPLPELIKEGINIPLIIGFTSQEGMRFLRDDCFTKLHDNFENHLAEYLGPERRDVLKIPGFINAVKEFYFKDESDSVKQAQNFVNYTGDLQYYNPIQMCIDRQMMKPTATYVYLFSFQAAISIFAQYYAHIDTRGLRGPGHIDEWNFVWRMSSRESYYNLKNHPKDYLVMQRMTKMWTNFAKFGNPTPNVDDLITAKWQPITPTQRHYMEIGDELKPNENPRGDSWNFWKSWNIYH